MFKSLLECEKAIIANRVELVDLENEYKKSRADKIAVSIDLQENLKFLKANIDIEKITLVKELLVIFGKYNPNLPPMVAVVDDFKEWIVTEQRQYYCPRTGYYATKEYDCFGCQREDHAYGSGPRHGRITFSIGLNHAHKNTQFSETQKEAMLYALNNIEVL